jgi:hypothetical protein
MKQTQWVMQLLFKSHFLIKPVKVSILPIFLTPFSRFVVSEFVSMFTKAPQ